MNKKIVNALMAFALVDAGIAIGITYQYIKTKKYMRKVANVANDARLCIIDLIEQVSADHWDDFTDEQKNELKSYGVNIPE